jgi:hypothetical protein
MTSAIPFVQRRAYSMHGVGIEVTAREPEVIEAMDLRLRAFRGEAGNGVVMRFAFEPHDERVYTVEAGRPVYDTPYGTLRYFPHAGATGGELAGVHLWCDRERGVATIRAREFRDRGLYFATHPLTTIALMELMERHRRFSLHAACLVSPAGNGILLCGPSGSGKSTLTMALAASGLQFLSDDVVFLAHRPADAGGVEALGFADTIGLSAFAAERFPELRERAAEAPARGFPKRLARIEDLVGRPAVLRCIPRAVVFPSVASDQASVIGRLDPGEALLRLAPDVLLTEPYGTQAHLDAIGALLRQVSCFAVTSGADLERAASMIVDAVDSGGGQNP